MTQNSATHEREGGIHGEGKEQGKLKNRDGDQGIVRDRRGQEQPKDRERAQGTDGQKAQRDAARTQPPFPGQPAGGE